MSSFPTLQPRGLLWCRRAADIGQVSGVLMPLDGEPGALGSCARAAIVGLDRLIVARRVSITDTALPFDHQFHRTRRMGNEIIDRLDVCGSRPSPLADAGSVQAVSNAKAVRVAHSAAFGKSPAAGASRQPDRPGVRQDLRVAEEDV